MPVPRHEQQLIKANKRRQSMTIRSPIDGTVQTSAITTIGQVATAGGELMRIVPSNGTLQIEAYLPNREIGFIAAGQPAVIEIKAFPFTRYGTIEDASRGLPPMPSPNQMHSSWRARQRKNYRASFPPAMFNACRTLCSR